MAEKPGGEPVWESSLLHSVRGEKNHLKKNKWLVIWTIWSVQPLLNVPLAQCACSIPTSVQSRRPSSQFVTPEPVHQMKNKGNDKDEKNKGVRLDLLHLEMCEISSSWKEVTKDVNKEVFGASRRETRVHFHHKPENLCHYHLKLTTGVSICHFPDTGW